MKLKAGGGYLCEGLGWRPLLLERLWVVTALFFVLGCAPLRPQKELSLAEYVNLRDDSYSWELLEAKAGDGYRHYLLRLVSQTWRTEAEVDRTLWTHRLSVFVPDSVLADSGRSAPGLLIIDGGSNGEEVSGDDDARSASMALSSGMVVANLGMVPNQPLGFAPEFRGRYEDDLVAHTWNLYMDTGDQAWLARWPMVKSAVRAMDAVEELLGSAGTAGLEKPLDLSGFVVTGWAPLGMPDSPEGPAGVAARQALKAGVGIHEGSTPPPAWDLALVGLFGLGLSRPLEGAAAGAVAALNASTAPTLSADLPSGLDGDTGHVLGCAVQARATLAFIGPRPGFLLEDGPANAGEVWVADLGVSKSLALSWLQARRRGGTASGD